MDEENKDEWVRGTKAHSSTCCDKLCSQTPLSSEATKGQRRTVVSIIYEAFYKANNQHPICWSIGVIAQLCQVHEANLVKEKEAGRV